MGDLSTHFARRVHLVSRENVQIRHNALESARVSANKVLFDKYGETGYRLQLCVYPHIILRENKMIATAGADRLQEGMRRAFGKPTGRAARVHDGQSILIVYVPEDGVDTARKALDTASTKFPMRSRITVEEIRKIIESAPMPSDIANEVRSAYRDLERKTNSPQVKVAVRSSATSEDLPDASFAGQQDTYLNVKGEDALVHYVQKCWSSLYTPRAIFYREEKGFPHEKVLISVGVQKMVESEVSGVIFTLDPVNGDPSKIIIESSCGLGEALVAGVVRPDRCIVDKGTLQIVHKEIVPKMVEHVPNHETGLTMEREVPAERRNAASLGDEQVVELARLARDIEDHYQTPQDVEFAVERSKSGQKVYVVQTRPETFWARMKSPSESGKSPVLDRVVVVQGLAASPGLHAGRAKIVVGLQDAGRMMKDKDILVTRMTNPDWVPYMKIAGAIVTEDGGTTCHAAIVSREMGIPCIVGARNATKVLQTGKEYTVDAKAGVVYQGLVEDVLKPAAAVGQQIPTVIPVTSTRIYVNISLPELAEKVARETHADGVGLLRAEHMMLSVGSILG